MSPTPPAIKVMAPVVAGARRPPFVRAATSTGTLSTTTLTGSPAIPAGTKVGDQLFAAAATNGTADTIATPSGWTALGPITTTGTGTNFTTYVFARTADGTEGASVTLTKTGTASAWMAAVISAGDTAGREAAVNGFCSNSGDTSPVLPSSTPSVDRSTVLGLLVGRTSQMTLTLPTGWVQVSRVNSGSVPTLVVVRKAPIAAGVATGTATGTWSATSKWTTCAVPLKGK